MEIMTIFDLPRRRSGEGGAEVIADAPLFGVGTASRPEIFAYHVRIRLKDQVSFTHCPGSNRMTRRPRYQYPRLSLPLSVTGRAC